MLLSTDVHRQDSRTLVQRTRCYSLDSQPDWDIAFDNTACAALHRASPVIHTSKNTITTNTNYSFLLQLIP